MRLFVFALLASLAVAQQPQQTQAPEPPKKARVEGVVVSLTGEAIPRAQIRLQGQPTIQGGQLAQAVAYTATSDDAGKFAIEEIEPGQNFQLSAQRPGFVSARYGARNASSPPVPLTLEAGRVLMGVSLVMTPQAVISGRVTDANGDPIQNATVMLLRRGYQRGVRQLVTSGSAGTNDQGDYRVANLTPGRYFLMVQDRQLAVATSGPASPEGPIATYYPNGTDAQSAAPIDVVAGQELRGIDVRMRKGRVYSARGKVVGPTAAPGPGTILLTIPKSNDGSPSTAIQLLNRQAQVRPDGSFEIRGLLPGTYTVQALTPAANTTRSGGRMDFTIVDADVADLSFALTPGSPVHGTIRLENGDIKKLLPAQDPNATLMNALTIVAGTAGIALGGNTRIVVALSDLNPQPLNTSTPANPKEDGTFTLEGVAPSRYQLNVAGLPQGHYVKSATMGGTDVTRNPVDLTSGAGGSLDIVLSSKAADVTGAVRNEKSVALTGMMVTLWTRDPEPGTTTNGVKTVTADQNGGFTFANLRPGVYYVAAWEEIDTGLAQARDFLNQFTGEATKLELAEGGHSATEVKLIPSAKIKAAEEKLP